MTNELVNFPLPVYDRIPNFKSANEAGMRLAELAEFKTANVIKINPDKPQEVVRSLALEAHKEILVPIPRLRSGLFVHVAPMADMNKSSQRALSKIDNLINIGKPLGVDSKIKVRNIIAIIIVFLYFYFYSSILLFLFVFR